MTATDELRKLLDERGVEWRDTGARVYDMYNNPHSYRTEYELSDGRWTTATEALSGTLNVNNLTPEQAVAATLGSGTCKPTEEDCCPICGEDLVKCNVGIGELGGAVELDPPIYHNYCPNCGAKVVER